VEDERKKEGISKTPGSRITENRYYYGDVAVFYRYTHHTVTEDGDQTAL